MISEKERVSLVEMLFRKTGMSLPELAAEPGMLEDMIEDIFKDLQCTKEHLLGQVLILQARNRDLEEYVGIVAHDLKEPLVVMALSSHLITNVPDLGDVKLKEYLRQMGHTADQMKRIIHNLLLFAEVSQAEAPVGLVRMDEVVASVQDRLSHLIREQQARIVLPEMWPLAIGYGPWIEEVWANFLSNGLKYGGRPPYLELGASTWTDGLVRFWVRDNGPGIPSAVREHLFTSIEQIGHLGAPEHGLGLSIVLRIVEKLRGQVGIESEAGLGNRFFFTLPAAPPCTEQDLAILHSDPALEKSGER
jgi:signal transduction histidine kinase